MARQRGLSQVAVVLRQVAVVMRLLMRLTQLLNCRAAQFSVPFPMSGVVLLEQRAGFTPEAAAKQANTMLVTDFLELVGNYDPDEDMPTQYEDGNPQPAGETSTGG